MDVQKGLIVSATGHRPQHLKGFSKEAVAHYVDVAEKMLKILEPREFITGMALGWDMACAQACVNLGISFTAAVPFIGQESRWPQESKDTYNDLLAKSDRLMVVSPGGYESWKMLARNKWMNQNADAVASLYDVTKPTGGTAHCIRDALQRGKVIYNTWGIYSGVSDELTLVTQDQVATPDGS